MTNQNAARVLDILAHQEPDYEERIEEYQTALNRDGVSLPENFPEQALSLLRADPDQAERIDRYAENLSHMQTYGVAEIAAAGTVAASLILLLKPQFTLAVNTKHVKGAFKVDTQRIDVKTLASVLKTLAAAVTGELGKTLTELSEKFSAEAKNSVENAQNPVEDAKDSSETEQ